LLISGRPNLFRDSGKTSCEVCCLRRGFSTAKKRAV